MYSTNQPREELSLEQAVLAYRSEYLVERSVGRLKGRPLSLKPMYVQRDDHATGLIRLLSIALRVLTLLEFVGRRQLAAEGAKLAGLYAGNPQRETARPTAERLLEAGTDRDRAAFADVERRLAEGPPCCLEGQQARRQQAHALHVQPQPPGRVGQDLDAAVRGAYNGIFYGKGEVCNAGSRLFVENKVQNEFLEKLVARAKKLQPADPLDPKMSVAASYGVWALPSTFIIDRQGKRVLFANGSREWDSKPAHALIESLLK